MAYPTGVKVYIDDKDATYYLFGTTSLDPDADNNTWRDIDISGFIRQTPGIHTIKIVPASGAGRADVRIEIR